MQALFSSVSNGYFPMELTINFVWELRFMFAFYAIGFVLLSINFVALYLYAQRKAEELGLDEMECFDTQTEIYIWSIGTAIGAISLLLSVTLPADFIGFSGYVLFALFPLLYGLGFYRTTARASIGAKVV
ncbi:MAG: hypothetical protein ABJK37_23335 [Paraglaciecola sp.]|uniref:hypothetical protein n=1 Tax=Paraglaciecola sp. TaxID=1920173 RepID=UPI003299C446